MAVDIQKLFNEELPSQLKANPDKAKEIGAKYLFNITGEGGGEWSVDLSASGPSVTPGNSGGAECTLNVAAEDFQKLYEKPQEAGMQLFFSGKLKVTGNPMLAQKLNKLFQK